MTHTRMNDVVALDALDLARAIRCREVSCVEVMQAYLDRIDAVNPKLNAIVSLREPGVLLAEAADRDADLAAGRYRGWLHGFPYAVKDLCDVAGIVTTMGSPIFAGAVARADTPFVARIRASGAIFIGKTNTPEFGLGSQTYNSVFGVTRNAYDQRLCAGGSSGGAAAALAARLLPIADGSDYMGSLRNPAAFNNVIGFRPSVGRVPEPGFLASPAVTGPLARTVSDAARLLSVMAAPAPHYPSTIGGDPRVFGEPLAAEVAGARIGWLGDLDGHLPVEAGVLDLCAQAGQALAALGCRIEPTGLLMPPEQVWEAFLGWRHLLMYAALHPLYDQPQTRALLKPEVVWEIEGGAALTAADIVRAEAGRTRWFEAVLDLFERYDYLLAPSAQVFPFPAETPWPTEVAGRPMDTYHRWMETVAPWSLAGLPVLSLPAGFGAGGRPTGVQLIGRPRADLDVLRLGYAYEQVTQWTKRHPPQGTPGQAGQDC